MADALRITTCLDPEAMQAILDETLGTSQGAEGEDPAMIKGNQEKEKDVPVAAGQVLGEMHVTDWAAAQKEDTELDAVLQWLESKKKTNLRTLPGEHSSGEEGQIYGGTTKTLLSSKIPSTCAAHQKGRMTICYSLWCGRCTGLPP